MALTIDILANNELESAAIATADALDRITKREEQISKLATLTGRSYQDVSKAVAMVNAEQQAASLSASKLASKAEKVAKAERDALEKKRKTEVSAARQRESALKKQEGETKKVLGVATRLAAAIAGTVVAAAAVGTGLAVVAAKAAGTAKEAKALINAFTGGRGEEAIKIIDGMAGKLGISINDARQQFIKFRQAGADNSISLALINMRADLMAVGLSADSADKEISKVLQAKGHNAQLAALKEISVAYEGIGDGAKAAAENSTSISGAMARLSDATSAALAKLWEKIGPSIEEAANHLSDLATGFLSSKEGEKIITGVADAFIWLAKAVKPTLEFIREHKTLIGVGLVVAFGAVAAAIGAAVVAFVAANAVVLLFVAKVALIGAAVGAAAAAIYSAISTIIDRWDEVKQLPETLYNVGKDVVLGFIGGIKEKISAALSLVTDFGSKVGGAFKKVLGISSPSKLFEGFGSDTVAGYEKGQSKQLQKTGEMPLSAVASAQPMTAPAMTQSGSSTTNSTDRSITIENITIQGGGNPQEIARSIRQQLQLLMQAGSISRGVA